MIRVVNLRNYSPINGEILIKVDRSTVLGNPFMMRTESERDLVCDKYAHWLNEQVKTNRPICDALNQIWSLAKRGNYIALGCWCAPKRCHGDYIKQLVESRLLHP